MSTTSMTIMEKKLDMVLDKLDHIEALLSIEEDLPLDDEIHSIKEYMVRKKEGRISLQALEDVIDEI